MQMQYVCFNISSLCDMSCPYCYRVGNSFGNVSYKSAIEYIDYLISNGCTAINITGGEPLLNPDWKRIIRYCSYRGLFTILSTNGLQLNINDDIMNQIDVLSLPLDGGDAETNKATRTKKQYKKILSLINAYRNTTYHFSLKVNTVLTKYNYMQMDNLLQIVDSPHMVWKIFELREKGEYYNFPPDKILSETEICAVINHLLSLPHMCKIHFMGNSSIASDDSNCKVRPNYFILDYNGDLYFATESENQLLFNLNARKEMKDVSKDFELINNQYYEELKDDWKRH